MSRITWWLIGFHVWFACSTLVAEGPRLDQSPFADMEPRWKEAMASLDVPGVSMVVVKGDEVIMLDGWGVADPRTGKTVDPDTMFYIASCTKPYTATGVAILQDESKLKFDDAVEKHLPRFELSDAELTSRVTIADLASHRYGINSSAIVFNDAFSGEITEELYYRLLPTASIANRVAYSNVHFTLLGRVIESASGKSWRHYLEEKLFLPAGMTRTTGYASRMYGDSNTAAPLVRQKGAWAISPVIKSDNTMHAAGGMGTTARDLGQWMRLNLNGGRVDGMQIVSEAAMKALHQRHSDAPPRGTLIKLDGFGLAWMLGNYRGKPVLAHGGGYLAAAAYITMLPEDGIGVAVLVNSSVPGASIIEIMTSDVLDRLLGTPAEKDLLPSAGKKARQLIAARKERESTAIAVTADRLVLPIESYAGTYRNADWGTIILTVQDGRLNGRAGEFPLHFNSRGKDEVEARAYPGDDGHNGAFEVIDSKVAAFSFSPTGGESVRFVRE